MTPRFSTEAALTVAGTLAVTAARTGLRVLLVDADLRKPSISSLFGVETPRGLAHLWRRAMQRFSRLREGA